jgi:hypothetical protein
VGGRVGDTILLAFQTSLARQVQRGGEINLAAGARGIHSKLEDTMRRARNTRPFAAAVCLLLAACGDGTTPAAPDVEQPIYPLHATVEGVTAHDHAAQSVGLQDELAQLRQVTARFHRVEEAIAAGYELGWVNGAGVRIITGCVAHPTAGAMGYHYFNQALVDDLAVDPLQPEVLVYAPASDGGLQLVAVEWVVRGPNTNPPGVSDPPSVLGMEMHILVPAVGFWLKHAWIWKHNPAGMFADWNPTVTCP